MKLNLKKFISVMLMCALFSTAYPASYFGAEDDFGNSDDIVEEIPDIEEDPSFEDEETEQTGSDVDTSIKENGLNVLFNLDFESYSPIKGSSSLGLTKTAGNTFFSENIDKEHGQSLAVQTMTNAYFTKQLEKPIFQGAWHIGFDYRTNIVSGNSGRFHLSFESDAKGSYNQIMGRETSGVGMYPGLIGYSLTTLKKTIKANQWYHFDIYTDFTSRKIFLAIDNVITESYNMPENMDRISLVYLRSLSGTVVNDSLVQYYDNLRMMELNDEGIKKLHDEGRTLPDVFYDTLGAKLETEMIGNMFFEFSSPKLDLTLMNKKKENYSGKATYTAYYSNGEKAWETSENVSISASGNFKTIIEPKVSKYDIYTLDIRVINDKNPEDVFEFKREFSIINQMKGNDKNQRFGIVTHIHQNNLTRTQPEEGTYLLDKLGIGYIRNGFYLTRMSEVDGKWQYTGEYRRGFDLLFEECRKNDIKVLAFLSGYPSTVQEKGNPVPNPAQLELFKKKTRDFVEYCKASGVVTEYQLGNEINNKGRWYEHMPFEVYVQCYLKPFYEVVKEVQPEAKVIIASTARADAGWIEGVLKAGGSEYCDGASFHPYTGPSSPEITGWYKTASQVREMAKKQGREDLFLMSTEGNQASDPENGSEHQQGAYLIRCYEQNLWYNPTDVYFSYAFQTPDYDQTYRENVFGILRGWDVDNKNGPKPAFMAAANYHAMMERAEIKEYVTKDDYYLYRHETPEGDDTLMMYSDLTVKTVTLDLGVKSGTVYDWYGNPTEVYSEDGIYTFNLTETATYFKSAENIEKIEVIDNKIVSDTNNVELPIGSKKAFNLTFDKDYDVTIDARDTLNANLEKTENGAKITVNPTEFPEKVDYFTRRHNYGTEQWEDYVKVTFKKNGKTYAVLPLSVSYLEEAIEVNIKVKPYSDLSDKHFVGVIDLNNISDYPVSGTLKMTSPDIIVKEFGEKRIENLRPGEKQEFKFNIPATLNSKSTKYFGEFVADDGAVYTFELGSTSRTYYFNQPSGVALKALRKADKAPVIDGKFSKEEWQKGKWASFGINDATEVESGTMMEGIIIQGGEMGRTDIKSDFDGSMYALWSEDGLYVCAVVIDDIHCQKSQPVAFFRDDVLSVYTKPTTTQRHNTRIDFALSEFKGGPWALLNWSPIFKSYYHKELPPGDEGVEYSIIKEGTRVVYEAKIPWHLLCEGGIEEYQNIHMQIAIHDYDVTRDKTVTFGGWTCFLN